MFLNTVFFENVILKGSLCLFLVLHSPPAANVKGTDRQAGGSKNNLDIRKHNILHNIFPRKKHDFAQKHNFFLFPKCQYKASIQQSTFSTGMFPAKLRHDSKRRRCQKITLMKTQHLADLFSG